jgi:hypothetical protein
MIGFVSAEEKKVLWCVAGFILALFDLNCIFLLGIKRDIHLAISLVTAAQNLKKKKSSVLAAGWERRWEKMRNLAKLRSSFLRIKIIFLKLHVICNRKCAFRHMICISFG